MTKKRVMTNTALIEKIREIYPTMRNCANFEVVDWSLNEKIKEAQK